MLAPPEQASLRGNSHMMMQDKNNLQVADLILKWIAEKVSTAGAKMKISARARVELTEHDPRDRTMVGR